MVKREIIEMIYIEIGSLVCNIPLRIAEYNVERLFFIILTFQHLFV